MAIKQTILLVEDEPLILELVRDALEDGGFAVTAASDGEEARDALASETVFEGLVTDICLPGQMTGWDVARLARTKIPDIAVIYATGHGELDWPVQGVPGSGLVPKPYAPDQVVAALALHLTDAR